MRVLVTGHNFYYSGKRPDIVRRNHNFAQNHKVTTKLKLDQSADSHNFPDYRQLAIQQELFINSKYSPGSPIFLPKGTKIFHKLTGFLRAQYQEFGFQEVISPIIYKSSLWKTSGHWENYADDMYSVTGRGANGTQEGDQDGQNEEYGLKPMNCPGHCLIFDSKSRSYRDLPLRYAEFGPLHRNEIKGALSGLTRVRCFHQDDGHIFCRPSQIKEEIRRSLEFVKLVYRVLGLDSYRLVLSTRPQNSYIGSQNEWDNAESALSDSLQESGLNWTIKEGDGAFYGPKIDIILTSADGREHQTATIQLDFQLPKRFKLHYQSPAPEIEQKGHACTNPALLKFEGPVTPVLIHRAMFGSIERIMALLIENYNGNWPFWLNPNQVVIITTNDSPEVLEYACQTRELIQGLGNSDSDQAKRRVDRGIESDLETISLEIFDKATGVGQKIAVAKKQKYSIIVLIGPKDIQSKTISVDFSGIPNRNQYTNGILRKVAARAKYYDLEKNKDFEDFELLEKSAGNYDQDTHIKIEAPIKVSMPAKWLRSIVQQLQRTYC